MKEVKEGEGGRKVNRDRKQPVTVVCAVKEMRWVILTGWGPVWDWGWGRLLCWGIRSFPETGDSQGVVLGQQHQHLLEILKMQIPGLPCRPTEQRVWGGASLWALHAPRSLMLTQVEHHWHGLRAVAW